MVWKTGDLIDTLELELQTILVFKVEMSYILMIAQENRKVQEHDK